MSSAKRWTIPFLCLLWCLGWLVATRFAMLDDSLIHLRYAINLARVHFITYDGVTHSFGTSSPFYVTLLALLYTVWHSVFLPKTVSVLCYVALLVLLVRLWQPDGNRTVRLLTASLLVVFTCPMAIRWLSDGMETSLVCLSVSLLAIALQRASDDETHWSMPGWFLFGFYLTMLRIELSSLTGMAFLILFFGARPHASAGWLGRLLRACPIFLGSLAALGALRLIFGHALPDTAVAKAGVPSLNAVILFVHVSGGAVLLGTGSALLLLLSAILASRNGARREIVWVLANAPLVTVVGLACLRGQAIQGIRYFIWATLFSIVWNLLEIRRNTDRVDTSRAPRMLAYGLLAVCLLLLPVDTYLGFLSMRGRAQTFQQMRGESLDRLSGQLMIADDIGFIGYFSRANVCDLNGLVNGRNFAAFPQDRRIRTCVARSPRAVFVTPPRLPAVARYLPNYPDDWIICDRVNFTNVRFQDTHILVIRKEDIQAFCPRPNEPTEPAPQIPDWVRNLPQDN